MLDEALADIIEEAARLASSKPTPPISADAWGDGVAEKYRRHGSKL
jgi:hypothetical protein